MGPRFPACRLFLVLACLATLQAEAETYESRVEIGPGGVRLSVPGGPGGLAVDVKDGSATMNFSVFGRGNRGAASGQPVSPPVQIVRPLPSSSLTDSDTFFRSVGKPD